MGLATDSEQPSYLWKTRKQCTPFISDSWEPNDEDEFTKAYDEAGEPC